MIIDIANSVDNVINSGNSRFNFWHSEGIIKFSKVLCRILYSGVACYIALAVLKWNDWYHRNFPETNFALDHNSCLFSFLIILLALLVHLLKVVMLLLLVQLYSLMSMAFIKLPLIVRL